MGTSIITVQNSYNKNSYRILDSIDFFKTYRAGSGEPISNSGDVSNNPEIDKPIMLSDPAGTYYVNIMDWDEDSFGYKFSIGYPNGNVQFIEGTFDRSATEYINDTWNAWGDSTDSFRVLKIENSVAGFTVTKL